jgi:hypothetical protein
MSHKLAFLVALSMLIGMTAFAQAPCTIEVKASENPAPVKKTITITATSSCALDGVTIQASTASTDSKFGTGSLETGVAQSATFQSDTAQVVKYTVKGQPRSCPVCLPVSGETSVEYRSFLLSNTPLTPTSGTIAGGTTVTITGQNFDATCTAVTFDGVAGTEVKATNTTTLTAKTPAGKLANVGKPVPVAVTCGGSTQTLGGAFTYTAANVTIGSLSPASGLTTGGDLPGITGTDFTDACTSASFGGGSVPVRFDSSTHLTVLAPGTPKTLVVGPVDVTLNCGGKLVNGFTYTQPVPTVSAATPLLGVPEGGAKVTITGTNFTNQCKVTFGGIDAANVDVSSETQITANAPKAADQASLTSSAPILVKCGDQTASTSFVFVYTSRPTVNGTSPAVVAEGGGTVTIQGLFPAAVCKAGTFSVAFGRQAATSATLNADGTITAVIPALAAAVAPDTQDVRVPVTVNCGQTAVQRSAGFNVPIARASFIYRRDNGNADAVIGEKVTFTSTVGDNAPTAVVESTSWDFGDTANNTATGNVATHTYGQAGTYLVKETVKFAGGGTSVATRRVTVLPTISTRDSFTGRLLLPAQAALSGGNGSFFKSQAWLLNSNAADMIVRLRFVARDSGSAGGGVDAVVQTIPAGGLLSYSDILAQLFGKTTSAAAGDVVVETAGAMASLPRVTGRTYNDAGFFGTFGQFVPAFDLSAQASSSVFISGLEQNAASRTNIGVVNLGTTNATVTVQAVSTDGVSVGTPFTFPSAVAPGSFAQVAASALVGTLTAPFSVQITSGQGTSIAAYASKLDNTTSDPIFIPSTLKARRDQWLHPVADLLPAVDAMGIPTSTEFRTSITVGAPTGSASVSLDVNQINLISGATATISQLPVRGSRFYQDFLQLPYVIGLPHASENYFVTIHSEQPTVVWARAYSLPANDRTQNFGQLIPAFGPEDTVGAGGSVLLGVSQSTEYRTNVGFANISDHATATVTATLYTRDAMGAFTATGTPFKVTLLPAQASAIYGSVIRTQMNVTSDVTDGYIKIVPDEGSEGDIYAWASLNDNKSSDSIYIQAQPLDAPVSQGDE